MHFWIGNTKFNHFFYIGNINILQTKRTFYGFPFVCYCGYLNSYRHTEKHVWFFYHVASISKHNKKKNENLASLNYRAYQQWIPFENVLRWIWRLTLNQAIFITILILFIELLIKSGMEHMNVKSGIGKSFALELVLTNFISSGIVLLHTANNLINHQIYL